MHRKEHACAGKNLAWTRTSVASDVCASRKVWVRLTCPTSPVPQQLQPRLHATLWLTPWSCVQVRTGQVEYTPLSGNETERKPQLFIYDECLRLFGSQHTWMAFVDADEFLVLRDHRVGDLPSLLQEYEAYGALVVNWQVQPRPLLGCLIRCMASWGCLAGRGLCIHGLGSAWHAVASLQRHMPALIPHAQL